MERTDIIARLQELNIYNDFFYRKELKALSSLMKDYEQLNCLLTGVHQGNRKMIAVTDRRLLIVFTALGAGDVQVIRREAVKSWQFTKTLLLFHTLTIQTNGGAQFVFTNTQGHLKKLFAWAMEQPIPA